jgi:hypothetical protein
MLKRILLIFLLTAGFCSATYAQVDCGAVLNTAIEEYNAGHFSGISSLLNDCLGNFSREQRERAYMLLTQTYLLLDDPFAAEQSYLKLLQANPEFLADENRDPIDVVYLSKKFTATPLLSWYLNIGSNVSTVTVLNPYTARGTEYQAKDYAIRPGLQFGGGLEYNFNDNIVVGTELNYVFTSFRVTQAFDGNDSDEVIDRQNWFNVPIILKYAVNKGKMRPYGYVGYSLNFLLRDVLNVTLSNEGNFTTAESPDINYTKHRKMVNRALIFGGGVRYKVGLDYFFADLRLSVGSTNLSKPETRYEDENDFRLYGYIEDDFRLNNAYLSVGFVHPLYKPRKLKKARTRSVMRKIGKQESDDGEN